MDFDQSQLNWYIKVSLIVLLLKYSNKFLNWIIDDFIMFSMTCNTCDICSRFMRPYAHPCQLIIAFIVWMTNINNKIKCNDKAWLAYICNTNNDILIHRKYVKRCVTLRLSNHHHLSQMKCAYVDILYFLHADFLSIL